MVTVTKVMCDLCKSTKDVKKEKIPIAFTTEQTEGRSITPYLTFEQMDICTDCLQRIVLDLPLTGHGAMGNNEYTWGSVNEYWKQIKTPAQQKIRDEEKELIAHIINR